MKIAIFTPYAFPEMGACSTRMKSMADYLEKEGNEVIVFAPKRENAKSTVSGNVKYKRYNETKDAFKIVWNKDFDLIIGTGPPLTHSFLAILAGKLRGKKCIADIRDPWTHAYKGLGIYSNAGAKLWVYKAIEIIAYNLSDRVFVVTEGIKSIVEKEVLTKRKIVLVPNGTLPKIFKRYPSEGSKVRKELNIPKTARVGIYAGAFIKKGVEEMLEVLAPLMKEENFFVLLVISAGKGEMEAYKKLEQLTEKLGINKKVKFVNSKEFGLEGLPKYYSASDFGLDPLPKGMDDYCIPVKTYDFFACGLPVIAKGKKNGSLAKLIRKHEIGWVAQDWREFYEKTRSAIKSKELLNMGRAAMKIARENFDREISNKKIVREIKEIP